MATIVRLSRTIRHNEDVLLIERIEPENDSRSIFVLPIDGSVDIEAFGKNVLQLIERDKPKKLESLSVDCMGYMEGYCPCCGEVRGGNVHTVNNALCPDCGQRLDWSWL